GRYTFRVSGIDRAGNRTVVDRPIIVDRTITRVRWDRASFVPSSRQTAKATITLARRASLTVRVLRGDTVIRNGWSDKALRSGSPAGVGDGKATNGKVVRAGRYTIVVTAKSAIGVTSYRAAITVAAH